MSISFVAADQALREQGFEAVEDRQSEVGIATDGLSRLERKASDEYG